MKSNNIMINNRSGRPSWDSQPITTEAPVGGQTYYGNQAATAAPNGYEQTQAATAAPAQQSYSAAAPPAPTHTNVPASAFPAVTNQICTCMTVSESTAADMLEQAQQKPALEQSAPAKQEYASSQSTSTSQSYAPSASQTMSAPASAPTGSYAAPSRPSADGNLAARPAYAATASAGY